MAEIMTEVVDTPITIRRWKHDFRYQEDKFVDVQLHGFESTEKSLTDKEAFRVSLASLRGQLASGSGSPTVGSYSLKAGEAYNSDFDFSFLNRPDLSLVELHEYIEDTRKRLESFDDNLRIKISNELAKAEAKAKELEKAELAKAEKKSTKSE